jgi:hypothetical protein
VSVAETLIPAGVGLAVGLIPFGYTVRKDRRERQERLDEQRRRESKEQRLEEQRQRDRLEAVATRHLGLLGHAMTLLEAILVDADNADELLSAATAAIADLNDHAQGDLFVMFEGSPTVIWADRACRRLLEEGRTLAVTARAERQTGETARKTWNDLRDLTSDDIDGSPGPRELLRWATKAAVSRWPEPIVTFDGEWQYVAKVTAIRADLQLPSELIQPAEMQP